MAHYAYINADNIVEIVVVGKDESELIDGMDTETYYAQGTDYVVKRTSYNGKIRKRFAGIGYSYDPVNDVFIEPQPFASWSLDDDFCWQPPKPRPTQGFCRWDESKGDWVDASQS